MSLEPTRRLGRTGVLVTPLTLGTMNFGRWAEEGESIEIILAAIDAGITVLDTADAYGHGSSEEIVGKALKSASVPREDLFLATRFHNQIGDNPQHAGNSRRWIIQAVEDSLRRLGTDYLDLYQAHRPDPHTDLLETLTTLDGLVRSGKIRYYGTSAFPAHELVEAQWLAEKHGLIAPHTGSCPARRWSVVRNAKSSPWCRSMGSVSSATDRWPQAGSRASTGSAASSPRRPAPA
jgi:aryl-alcohol dehydrogenase-like predicted oxidoreductase